MKTKLKYWMCALMVIVAIGFAGCNGDDDDGAGTITLNSDGTLSFNKEGGDVTVKFKSTNNWTISTEEDADWLSFSTESGKAGDDISVTVTASANKTGATRNAKVSISAGGTPVDVNASQVSYKLVSKIEASMGGNIINYGYDALGRINVCGMYLDDAYKITYTDNQVRLFKDNYTGSTSQQGNIYDFTAVLGNDGKVTSISGTEEYKDDNNSPSNWKYNITVALTYSSNNELSKWEYHSVKSNDATDKYDAVITYVWENSSIKSIQRVETYSDNSNYTMQHTITPGTEKNDLNISIFMYIIGGGIVQSDWEQALYAEDLLGKRPALLPSKIDQNGSIINYTYTRSGENISTIVSAFESGGTPTTYTVSYKN